MTIPTATVARTPPCGRRQPRDPERNVEVARDTHAGVDAACPRLPLSFPHLSLHVATPRSPRPPSDSQPQ